MSLKAIKAAMGRAGPFQISTVDPQAACWGVALCWGVAFSAGVREGAGRAPTFPA